MNNNIIQITKTTTGIIMIIMWLVWRWQWWRRQQWLMLLLFIMIIMQGIYNYIPKTNHVPREYNVTTILWLQFWVPVMLYLYPLINVLCCCICTFWSTCTVPSRVVFSSSLMCFLGSLLWYFLNDFKIVIVVSVIIGYHFFFFNPSVLYFCLKVSVFLNLLGFFLAHIYYLLKVQFLVTDMIVLYCRRLWCPVFLFGMALPVFTCWFSSRVTLPS